MIYLNVLSMLLAALPFLDTTSASPISLTLVARDVNDFRYDSLKDTQQLWNDNDVATTLWNENIQSTLKIYAPGRNSYACHYLGDGCGMSCNEADCLRAGGTAYFVLWALQNYSNFLGRISAAVANVYGVLTSYLPGMPAEFTGDASPPSKDNTAGFSGIIQGLFIAASVTFPETTFTVAAIGLENGLLSVLVTTPEGKVYSDFAQASSALGDAIISIQTSIYTMANNTLIAIPSNDPGYKYSEDPKMPVQSPMNGEFAADVTDNVNPNPPEVIAALSYVAINWLWNNDKIFLAKTNDTVHGGGPIWTGYSFCDGDGNAYTLRNKLIEQPMSAILDGVDEARSGTGSLWLSAIQQINKLRIACNLGTSMSSLQLPEAETSSHADPIVSEILTNCLVTGDLPCGQCGQIVELSGSNGHLDVPQYRSKAYYSSWKCVFCNNCAEALRFCAPDPCALGGR
ncbi:uncharacterized protein BDZ99DRAFT_519237 [Mytilinidion resinicola]|uniref:Uncharacterized protein n=1 Tax=Mytilinidion resinicola TaxID=574789 RepID=A0A6A6YT64_9PEZI|nr:uncharacterized protein BDZ99DRAFT_519237 [Mytilinidion resinicola]KAF2812000.1 hypothetical protein BDZ99DRAFT_519237 [Mytilinidion resinicola]